MDFCSNDFKIPDAQPIVQLKEMKICQKQYLEEIKRKKQEEQESFRKDLKSIMTNCDIEVVKSGKKAPSSVFNPIFKNILMMSKWMMAEPKDLKDYILIPCPKGTRVSITRQEKVGSEVFLKDGYKLMDLYVNMPKNTQLDGIYSKKNNTIYILDMLWYDDNDMRTSETAFRRFWIRSKFYDLKLDVMDESSGIKLCFLEGYEFTLPQEIFSCFQRWPLFQGVDTDGFLFYHKDVQYNSGECDGVLWLFPYMIDEVLTMFRAHKDYKLYRPINYTNYLDYIEKFNEKMKKKDRYKEAAKHQGTKIDYQRSNSYSFDTTKTTRERNAELEQFCRPAEGWFNGAPNRRHNGGRNQDFTQDDMFSYGRSQGSRGEADDRGSRVYGNVHKAFVYARNRAMRK